jgi:methylglutaconyl-CoA hydratase
MQGITMETIIIEKEYPITTIIFNRPQKHNAFNQLFIKEFSNTLAKINNDPLTRVVIIKANGKSFCAGADLEWMQQMVNFNHEENYLDALSLAHLLQRLNTLKKPTIALVEGNVYGGGIGIVACADIVLATKNVDFCFSEVKIGLVPAIVCPFVINAIGARQARRYFLTGETFSATEAYDYGLVTEVLPQEKIENRAQAYVDMIVNNSPSAIAQAKDLIHLTSPTIIDDATLSETSRLISSIRISAEGQEGLLAFLQKRKPNWIKEKLNV